MGFSIIPLLDPSSEIPQGHPSVKVEPENGVDNPFIGILLTCVKLVWQVPPWVPWILSPAL